MLLEEVLNSYDKNKTGSNELLIYKDRYPEIKNVLKRAAKVIFISSAYLKTCDLYRRFMYYYNFNDCWG